LHRDETTMIAASAVAEDLLSLQPGWRIGRFPGLGNLLTLGGSMHVVKNVMRHLNLVGELLS
jgi:hypothetical protein